MSYDTRAMRILFTQLFEGKKLLYNQLSREKKYPVYDEELDPLFHQIQQLESCKNMNILVVDERQMSYIYDALKESISNSMSDQDYCTILEIQNLC